MSLPIIHAPVLGAVALYLTTSGAVSSYQSFLITVTLVYIIAALGLNIPAGFLGQLSLGQGAAFGVGAYVAAIMTLDHGWPVLYSVLGAFAVGVVLGLFIAIPSSRIGLIGVAMLSLGATLVTNDAIASMTGLTGGTSGRYGVVAPLLPGGAVLNATGITKVIVVTLVLVYLLHWGYRVSNAGRASLAIRGNKVGAAGLGLSVLRYNLLGFGLGTGVGAAAGALYAYAQGVVSPEQFTAELSIFFLLMVLLGGAGTRWGPVLGGTLIGLLPIVLSHHPNLNHYIYGALLLVLVRVLPRGIVHKRGARVSRLVGIRGREKVQSEARPDKLVVADPLTDAAGLAVDNVSRHFGGDYAVTEVSLEVKPGEVTAIVGPNGSGKTTLLNLISGFYRPHGGTVSIDGKRIDGITPHRISALGVARTFQVPQLFPDLTVAEHLALARRYAALYPRPQAAAVAESLLVSCGFEGERLEREARTFAHGQQRFLEICMALLRAPRVLLLDEPAAGLSHEEIERLEGAVAAASAAQIAVVVVEHHHDFVRNVADKIVAMHLSRAIWQGIPADFASNEDVRAAYLQLDPGLEP